MVLVTFSACETVLEVTESLLAMELAYFSINFCPRRCIELGPHPAVPGRWSTE